MNFRNRLITGAVATAVLGMATLPAFAQGYGGPGRDFHGDDHRFEQRHDDRHDFDRRHPARGPEFRRGGHLPPQFRQRAYYVNDWRARRLSPPPRGYQWVQTGADYALIAVATGLIAQIILNN